MAYKRKRIYGGPISVKRRRTGGRKPRVFKRRAGAVTALTSQSARGTAFGFRRRRIRPRVYRSKLWNDTLYKTHYRSVFDNSFVAVTSATAATGNGYLVRAMPSQFWAAGGGAQPSNVGGTVPVFDSDITIRGGMIRIALVNESSLETVRARIFLMRSNKYPNNSIVTSGNMVGIASLFDPSCLAGFREFGKVIMSRECTLLPGVQPYEIFKKIGVQKLDQDDWLTNGGYNYYWVACISKMSNLAGVASNVRITYSHNCTFVGDAQ